MASTDVENTRRVAEHTQMLQDLHNRNVPNAPLGGKYNAPYSVSGGNIKDSAGVKVSLSSVAADASRAASLAKDNMSSVGFAPSAVAQANTNLANQSIYARNAIDEALRQRRKKK